MHILEWDNFVREGIAGPGNAAKTAITVGIFDGVHRGHRVLIDKIISHDSNFLPVIITFKNTPKKTGSYTGDIISFRHKLEIFEELGVALVITADLNESFRHIGGTEFLRILQEQGRMGFLTVGSSFRCGFRQDTDAAAIRQLNAEKNIPAEIAGILTENGLPISSSRIRDAVSKGRFREAENMLGRPYVLDLRNADFPAGSNADGFLRVNAGSLGYVLPPQGTYNVKLHLTNGIKIHSEVCLEGGFIYVPEKSGFMEFLADDN